MSLLTSMSSGTTGMAAASAELSVVSDNIANSNTVGFKSGRAAFEDALAQSVVGGLGQIGLGSRLQAVQRLLSQGALSNTGVNSDLALQGQGFFVVHGTASDGRPGTFYTRAGQFTVDRDGYLVNLDGLRVQGYPADATGALQPLVGDLLVGTASSQPQATGTVTVRGNLASDAPLAAAWDPADPAGTSNFSTSVTVYDSLGKATAVQVYFSHITNGPPAGSTWDWHAMVDGADVGGTAGAPTQIADGVLTFNSSGALDTETTNSSSASFSGATANQVITFDFGDSITTDTGTGLSGTTQFAGPSSVTHINQDGYAAGMLTDMQVSDDGTIVGQFSNGQRRAVARVAIAEFASAEGLQRAGDQLFSENAASGPPLLGGAGTGGRGSISGGTLEGSNVDLGNELVTLIAYQRAYQANARTVTTSDEMLQELANLKR